MSFEVSIHITSHCYISTVYFRFNLDTKLKGALTDKLSSCTMDEGACAKLTYGQQCGSSGNEQRTRMEWKNRETLAFRKRETHLSSNHVTKRLNETDTK